MIHVAATAVGQRFWDADEQNDPSRFIKPRSVVWVFDSTGRHLSGPYVCINAAKRRLYDPVNREEIEVSPDAIPFTPLTVIDNRLEVEDRGERRCMTQHDLTPA